MSLYPTKYFSSDDGGAPQLPGQVGAVPPVLTACLITGYNEQPVAQLTWNNGIVTIGTNQNNRFAVNDIVLVQGVTNCEAFNGEFRLLTAAANAVTFAVVGTGLPATASGSITIKKAPAGGWVEAFTGPNSVVYRSDDPQSRRNCLRIDDSINPRFAYVRAYESMAAIDSGTAPQPTLTQYGGNGLTWIKSDAASAAARDWVVIADRCFFYLFTRPWPGMGMSMVYFGDLFNPWANDPNASILQGHATANPTFAGDYNRLYVNGESTGRYLMRAGHGVGGAVSAGIYGIGMQTYAGNGNGWLFPSEPGKLMMTCPLVVGEVKGTAMVGPRGLLPGGYQPLHNQPLSSGDRLPGLSVNGSGRECVLLDIGLVNSDRGRVAIDVDGPWR